MTQMVKGRGKQWETKTEEEACYGRSHQMALLHIVLMAIFLGMQASFCFRKNTYVLTLINVYRGVITSH